MISRSVLARAGLACMALFWAEQALASEQCMSEEEVFSELFAIGELELWTPGEPELDFGTLVLTLKQDGKAVYRYKQSGREIFSSWYIDTKADQTERLCLVANPFDSDEECARVRWSLQDDGNRARHLIFPSQCSNGKTGSRVASGIELNTQDLYPGTIGSNSYVPSEASAEDLPVCGDEAVKSTLAKLIETSPRTPEQTYGLRNAGNPKIAYTVKAVRTEAELLKGYLCSAIVSAAVDAPKGNESGLAVLQMFLKPYGILGDIDVAYSVKQMDDGGVYVNLE